MILNYGFSSLAQNESLILKIKKIIITIIIQKEKVDGNTFDCIAICQ